jgi:hypothetical protein
MEKRRRDLFIDVYTRKRIVIKYYYPFELEGIENEREKCNNEEKCV